MLARRCHDRPPDTLTELLMLSVNEFLARARSASGKGTIYKLGGGGMKPNASLPSDSSMRCDCSGFSCWALGISRQTNHPLYVKINGGWINTDAIVADAIASTGFFLRVETPRPGALVVYPSRKPHRAVGHIGIVTDVNGSAGIDGITRVIHCSSSNYRNTNDAIRETEPNVFRVPEAILAWYEGVS